MRIGVKKNIRLYHRMKLIKLDPFTIFLVLLGLLVIITLFMNWKSTLYTTNESFVNFQNQPEASGTSVYIPQYSSDSTHSVLSLYDNIYFDSANGTLIEVFAPSCTSNCDTTGKNITDITVASRDGLEITAIPTILDNTGNVKKYSSPQSLLTTTPQMYNEYVYTTSCANTNIYQVFYVSWYNSTYIHIVDLSSNSTTGTNMKTFLLNPSGIVGSQSSFSTTTLQPYTATPSTIAAINTGTLPTNNDKNYLNGSVALQQLGKDANNNVSYDITGGNIVVNSAGSYTIYNRNGNKINNPNSAGTFQSVGSINTFVINDISGLSILVTAYKNDTVIQLIVPKNKSYYLLQAFRFNQTGYVNNIQSDTENTTPTNTSSPTTPFVPNTTTLPNNLGNNNNISNLNGNPSTTSNVCGDDISCKWYWYFNTIAQKNGNGSTYFSDDYFLKTEAVPPVCPQCPQCPKDGTCTNCGGNGGCGTATTTPQPTSNATLPAGAITDSSGNVYIPHTDPSGNTRYVLYNGVGNNVGTKQNVNRTGTYIDSNGNLITSANPNTVVGGLTTTALGLGQVGTTGINTVGNLANNVVNTAGDAVGSVANTAGDIVGGVVNTAGNIVGGVANTAGDLARGVVGGASNFVGNLGNNVGYNQGYNQNVNQNTNQMGNQMGNQTGGSAASSLGYTQYGPTSGYTPGYTPIDNYSQYGALQSKGSNYMPVTTDFSAFRK
jgi:hypothetical protein